MSFWAIAVCSNPIRYRSRVDLFRRFAEKMERQGVNLLRVEAAFASRPHEVTEAGNTRHVQVRTSAEVWHKENLVNIGLSRLPADWSAVAWIDADIDFVREDWQAETVAQLQHFPVVQLWQHAIDLGPRGETLQTHQGFAALYRSGAPPVRGRGYTHWHPGYAWAARREWIEAVGGLMDHAILGAGDHHMAWSMIGKGVETAPPQIGPSYKRMIQAWQDRLGPFAGDVGFVPGTIFHHWHGKKRDRRYVERWQILAKHGFCPDFDLQRDSQGLWKLTARGARLREDLHGYLQARNEDSIDLE